MCTVVLLRRPGHRWPVLIAANRDEMTGRPSDLPGRHWPDRTDVVAGHDRLAGGSWLGRNDTGVVAAVLNREGSLGPAADKRSRGELVLDALDHGDAADAADALAALDPTAFRSFNLVIADNRDAFWLRAENGAERIDVTELPDGISMLTSADMNDTRHPRIAHYLPKFETGAPPDPDTGDWSSWGALLADRCFDKGAGSSGAMCIVTDYGYGTVSSSLIALASAEAMADGGAQDIWLYAPDRPDVTAFNPVALHAEAAADIP
ncbi:MAG: NRDE family protein [Alphaproteobacteria bacterium]|nr:NRDE family protein [Alphaproteobacteria bacterium]